jgi:hypothetical protein
MPGPRTAPILSAADAARLVRDARRRRRGGTPAEREREATLREVAQLVAAPLPSSPFVLRRGRVTVCTPSLRRALIEAAPSVRTWKQLAAWAGVNPNTLRRWRDEGRIPAGLADQFAQ